MNAFIGVVATISVIAIIVRFFSGSWKKAMLAAGGWILYKASDFLLDFIFWPYAQNKYGMQAIVWLTLIAMFKNFLVLLWYKKNGQDFLGFRHLSQAWFLKNTTVAFFALSIYEDSFVTLAFFHKGEGGKLSRKDILVFVASTVLGCVSFGVFWKIILVIVKAIWG